MVAQLRKPVSSSVDWQMSWHLTILLICTDDPDDLDVIAEAREDIQDISYFLISSSFYVYMTIAYLSI